MNDRNDIINQILDALGAEGSRELAEQIFDLLRVDGRISYDDRRGLIIDDDVDLIGEAAAVMRQTTEFPAGLTGEAAYYAAEGPRDQAVPELQRIEAVARAHGTAQSIALADEARTYLAWLADHESCADMPDDWEPA